MSEREGRGGRAGWRGRYRRGGLAQLGAVLVLVLLAALGGIGWIDSERAIHRACRAQPPFNILRSDRTPATDPP